MMTSVSSESSSSTVKLSTPKGDLSLHVCKDGTVDNNEWIDIYEASFPPDEKQDLDELQMCLEAGSMELDETRDENGRILCMTITEVFRPHHQNVAFLLACYTAVVEEFRGLGVGTIHRTKLAELLEDEYGHFLGLFTEIVSTKATGFDEREMETRHKRKRFFLKLGLRPIDIDYKFPSALDKTKAIDGELLWLPFSADAPEQPDADTLFSILQRIYTTGYGLHADDPFVVSMLGQLRR